MTKAVARRAGLRADLAHYDPHKGAKAIRAAEAAEKFYQKAKDPERLYQAIEAKLTLQAEFVLWWDTQASRKRDGRPQKNRNRSVTVFEAKDFGLDKMMISRWRAKLGDPEMFDRTLEAVRARCDRIVGLEASAAHVANNTGETEWYTPAEYLEAARRVLGGIDLDPATSAAANEIVQAARVFTRKVSGLEHDWTDPRSGSCGRVFLNPPYAEELVTAFIDRLVMYAEADQVEAAIVLVNNATDTGWFRRLADCADAICLKTGRIKFWRADTAETATPLQGQVFVYLGDAREAFAREFGPFGRVWVPYGLP